MSEPIKKPRRIPESYNPKTPEIAGMMKEVQNNRFKFPPISSFNGENGIFEMPPARFIGIRHNHMPGKKGRKQLGDFLSYTFQSKTWNDVVLNLPNMICGEASDFTCEYVPETDSFSFIVGVFSPAGTSVPEGLDYREVPATLVWVWKKEDGKDGLNELNKLSNDEYRTNFDAPGFPWQAFLRADTYAVLPIKMKEKQSPESYNPKKPEIANMMKESAGKIEMNKAYEVKTANGGSYIDGVPMLRWGEWQDNTYCGCVTALLNAAGIPASYEEVMGLSGVCYKAIMRYDWDPSSEIPQNGLMCEKNVGDAFGISVYTIQEEKEVWRQAKIGINNGFLVLLLGGRFEGEWTLACGYAVENGEDKFFGRTYFDYQVDSVPQNEIYTENKYFYSNGFPGWYPGALTRFYDKKCDPISRKQALKVSLKTCIKMFEQPPGEHHIFGYDAYDVLIGGFELDNAEYQEKCRNDQYHIGSLQDARRAAYVYLNANAGLLDGKNQAKLTETARLYKTMLDNLLAAVPYEKTSSVFNGSSDPVWNKKQRSELVSALRENKKLEVQARVIIAEILENWED